MPYCPDCGRHIALGDVQCPECGSRIGGEAPEGPTGPPATGGGTGPPEQERRPQKPRRSGQDPATRRRALGYAGGVLGVLVAGALGFEALDDTGPLDVVDDWRSAWAGGDGATYRELWHPETAGDPDTWWATESGPVADSSVRYESESREVIEQTGSRASVRETFLYGHPSIADRRRLTDVIDLRTADGDWRIHGVRTEAVEAADDCRRRFTITGTTSLDCE